MSHHWTHLRVSPSHLKRRMWTVFWVPWVSAVVTRSKVIRTRPPWARSPPSMKWGSRCTSSWTTPLVWPLLSQTRATTTTITTTLTVRTTPTMVVLTWTELPVHLGLWTTPVELYSAAPPLGRICTSVASPNQWVPFFILILGKHLEHIGWYVDICHHISFQKVHLVIVLGFAGIQVYPAAWYGFGFPATPHPSKRRSPTWNFTKMVRETLKYTFILIFGLFILFCCGLVWFCIISLAKRYKLYVSFYGRPNVSDHSKKNKR